MLSVVFKPIMLSAILLNVVMQSVAIPLPFQTTLCCIISDTIQYSRSSSNHNRLGLLSRVRLIQGNNDSFETFSV